MVRISESVKITDETTKIIMIMAKLKVPKKKIFQIVKKNFSK